MRPLVRLSSRRLLYVYVVLALTFGWAIVHRQHGGTAVQPRVHLFLPMNERAITKDPLRKGVQFCQTLLSALASGYEPIIYNWDLIPLGKKSHRAKVTGFSQLLDHRTSALGVREEDILVVADALDVWFQLPPADLARRFEEYKEDVVVGAEMHCFPNAPGSDACRNAPPSPLPSDLFFDVTSDAFSVGVEYSTLPRHANSGFVVGRLQHMRPLFRKLVSTLQDESYQWSYDQGAFNIALSQGDLAVDHRLRLVWCSAFDHNSTVFMNHGRHPDNLGEAIPPYDLYPPLARHIKTGECPVALHFNGVLHKDFLQELWNSTWYGSPQAVFRTAVRSSVRGRMIRVVSEAGVELRDPAVVCAQHWT